MKPQLGIIVATVGGTLLGVLLYPDVAIVVVAIVCVVVGGAIWAVRHWYQGRPAELEQIDLGLIGVLMVLAALWFWHSLVGNPLHELALIQRGQTVAGFVVDTWENAESGDRGGTQWFHGAVYRYRLPDGREFTQRTKDNAGRLKEEFRDLEQPDPIEVEYLPDNPAVSRIKGDGCRSVMEWLWRKAGVGGVILALLVSPGVGLLQSAVRNMKRLRKGLAPISLTGWGVIWGHHCSVSTIGNLRKRTRGQEDYSRILRGEFNLAAQHGSGTDSI